MTEQIEVEILDVLEFVKGLKGKTRAVGIELSRAFDRIGFDMESRMIGRFKGAYSASSPKNDSAFLRTRSGEFRSNLSHIVSTGGGVSGTFTGASAASITQDDIDNLQLLLFYTHPAARIHELGTVGAGGTLSDIVPKKAKSLTIPLPAALDPSGVPRMTAREALSREDVFFLTTTNTEQKGNVGLIVQEEPGGRYEALFLLARRVAIPPRLGFVDTWKDSDTAKFRLTEVQTAVQRGLDAGGRRRDSRGRFV